jgi:hypothetical protein
LDDELNRLPGKYRAPLVLCCLEGNMQDEAAQQLGWSIATLKRRLQAGRDLLGTRLRRRGLTLSALLTGLTLAEGASPAAVSEESDRQGERGQCSPSVSASFLQRLKDRFRVEQAARQVDGGQGSYFLSLTR